MADEGMKAGGYQILRYTPNLLRDEFLNIGVLLHAPEEKRVRVRLLEETDFGRLRRLHPHADLELLRTLEADLEKQFQENADQPENLLSRMDQNLSNVLQLSPRKGLRARDFEAEMQRLYDELVAPPAYRSALGAAVENSVAWIRSRTKEIFRRAGIFGGMRHGVAVSEFTFQGDPLRIDHSYRRNGTRGFVHAIALGRDPGQARTMAFTAERMRRKIESAEFFAVCEREPAPSDRRHAFVTELFRQPEVGIQFLPVPSLGKWAQDLAGTMRGS